MLKLICRNTLPVFLLLFGVRFAAAQSVDVFFGLGTAQASSNHQAVDTFGDGTLYTPPRLGGLFATTGGNLMLTPHFGFGGEISFRPSQGDYAGLKYRPIFYDFNGIYHPSSSKRLIPELQAGLGGVNLRFYQNQQACDAFVGCSNANFFVEGSNHFQVHMAAGLKYYVKGSLFVKPQVDLRYVNNFFQFGSNWVPEYSAQIGYTFGRGN
jgi:hypothetical protein